MYKKIKVLDKQTADKIAAGEVVDRPVSIVKELIENSIDAGATNITIEIKDGGKTYIRISDNGSGIYESDVETAFLRHATSKINIDEDLNKIETLGFRGEALASIAAVSKVEMITKTKEATMGVQVKIYGGEIIEKNMTGCSDGTTIIIKDLFYNTPARLKFMKKNSTESSMIIDLVSKMALAYENIKIKLINNDNILFATNGKGDRYKNIVTVFNNEISQGLIKIENQNQDMKIIGYISKPDFTRTNRKQQIFFVNGRNVKDKVIEKSIEKGYKERVFEGRFPVCYLFLEIKPELVDVNIHPNKKEVRFHNEGEILDFLSETIQNGLLWEGSVPNVKLNEKVAKHTQNLISNEYKNAFSENESEYFPDKNNGENIVVKKDTYADDFSNNAHFEVEEEKNIIGENPENRTFIEFNNSEDKQVDIKNILSKLVEEKEESLKKSENAVKKLNVIEQKENQTNLFSEMKIIGAVFNTYIVGYIENVFYLVDQHAAHERIFYEKFLKEFNADTKEQQMILVPMILEVPYSIKSTESSWLKLIRSMGFDLEAFGDKSYRVKGIPAFMSLQESESMLNYFIDNIDENIDLENTIKIDKLITRACKSSVKANDVLKIDEMENLMKTLSNCRNPYSCPHGRPTFIKMTKYELEKMFKRV